MTRWRLMAVELSGQPPMGPSLPFLIPFLQLWSLTQVQRQQSFPWSDAIQGQGRLRERCLFKMHNREIPTSGLRDREIALKIQENRLVILRERVTFSAEIAQPILCFGKMMQSGWGIDGVERCLVNGDIRIPVEPHGNASAESPKVKLSDALSYTQEGQSGRKKEREYLWRGVHLGHRYQDPAYVPGFRMVEDHFGSERWWMGTCCENLSHLEDHKKQIDEIVGNKQVLTMLTRDSFTPEEMGFMMLEPRPCPFGVRPEKVESLEYKILEAPEGEGASGENFGPLQEVTIEIGPLMLEKVLVNGIELAADSALRALRPACALYEFSTSGGKNKCYRRLVHHQKKIEPDAVKEALGQAKSALERHPRAQNLSPMPREEEQHRHALSPTPYAAWCSSCIARRARPDRHERFGETSNTGCPVLSFDFACTKAMREGMVWWCTLSSFGMSIAPTSNSVFWVMEIAREFGMEDPVLGGIGARAWFDLLVAYLEGKGFIFCAENPCAGKFRDKLSLLIHVDDMGRRNCLEQFFCLRSRRFSTSRSQHWLSREMRFAFWGEPMCLRIRIVHFAWTLCRWLTRLKRSMARSELRKPQQDQRFRSLMERAFLAMRRQHFYVFGW